MQIGSETAYYIYIVMDKLLAKLHCPKLKKAYMYFRAPYQYLRFLASSVLQHS
jgi:hypothetical protein